MPKPMSEADRSMLMKKRAELSRAVTNSATELAQLEKQISKLPTTAAGLASKFGLSAEEAAAALTRLQTLKQVVDAALAAAQRRICYLDMMLRYYNDTKMKWYARDAFLRGLLDVVVAEDPQQLFDNIDWNTRMDQERQGLQDAFASGWAGVTAGSTRLLGALTGGTDLMILSTGLNDKGKKASPGEFALAFVSLVGAGVLSAAARSWHLNHVVTGQSRTPRVGNATVESRVGLDRSRVDLDGSTVAPKKPDVAAGQTPAPKVATSQTSTLPSGTIADIEAMGIPIENFHKIQKRCFELDAQVAIRPSGVETPTQLRQGATPKPMHHKSKTANDFDGLIGSDPSFNGACAAFDPNTKFFEQAMRGSGMSETQVASGLDAVRAGNVPDMPPGFADADFWAGAVKRYQFRQSEWNGPIGDAVRGRVADGVSEIRNGIVLDRVGGEMRVVAGDHDIFETFINGRPATDAQADTFWQTLKSDGAGVEHGGHVRFNPQPGDYGPGGRFEIDVTGYSPTAAAAKVKSKFESDRQIFEVIMDKHSRQQLPDEVLGQMEGFVTPKRNHYSDGPYGDLRFRQDQDLHDQWKILTVDDMQGPLRGAKSPEVLVLIGPVGPATIMRAGEVPQGFNFGFKPTDFGVVAPGSLGGLPTNLLYWGSAGVRSQEIQWDKSVTDWFDFHDVQSDESKPICLPGPAALISSPRSVPWKPLAAVGIGLAMVGGVVLVATGGDGDTAAPIPTEQPAVSAPADTQAPATTALISIGDTTASTEPTVIDPPPSTTLAPPGPATTFGFGNPCGEVTHNPHPDYPGSPSYFTVSGVAAGLDGEIADDTLVTFTLQNSTMDPTPLAIGSKGIVGDAVFPINSFGAYAIDIQVGGTTPAGTSFLEVVVDSAEGPVGDCLPARFLPPNEIRSIVDDLGGGGGGGPAVIVPDPIPAPEDDLAPYREFYTRFETAHRDGDTDFLFSTLHPRVIERYGEATCRAFVDSVVGTVSNMRVIDGRSEPWDFPLDGLTTDISGSVTLSLDAFWVDEQLTVDVHLAPVENELRWFADCGDPV